MVPALGMILVVTFVVMHLAPGDPARAFAGEYATEETIEALRKQYGVDRPMWSQFTTYAGNLLRGDFGTSFSYGRPVTSIIAERLPATLLLATTALLVSVTAGILMGTLAARRPAGFLDRGINVAALLMYAVPGFWLAQIALLVLGLRAGLVPVLGMTDTRIEYSGVHRVLDVAHHLALPALVLAASEIALVLRLTRTGLIEQLGQNYTRTAEAKGLSSTAVLARHALPNAAIPLITVVGTRVGFLFSGAVVIETVFSWPGVGLLLVDAANSGDRPMALGLVVLVAVSVLAANLITDLVYARVDPRIRYD